MSRVAGATIAIAMNATWGDLCLSALCLGALCLAQPVRADSHLASPNGRIRIAFDADSYQASLDGVTLIGKSRLGIEFREGGALSHLRMIRSRHEHGRSTYTMPVGKTRDIDDAYEEYAFDLREARPPFRELGVVFRVFNDGFGFRYLFPQQRGLDRFVIRDELTAVKLASNPTLYALPLQFNSSYEWYYRVGKLTEFRAWDNLALPLLLQYPDGKYVGITEANLTDYAGMYLERARDPKGNELPDTLETRLPPWPREPDVKVRGTAPFVSPWRVFMIGDSIKTLVESNLIYDLNEPSAIEDTSWIHPGKIQFPWWNGYIVPQATAARPAGLNTATLEHYIDFCAANGIEYHSVDGFDQAWYGGPVDPFGAPDVLHPIPALDLPQVLAYARQQKVGTRLWVNWKGLAQDLDRALSTYETWGVEGIMVDFLNRDDQEMVRSYEEILRKTAEHHLTVTFHGVFKPTGQSRTYPHLLTHEGVLGTEYNKWGEFGSTPEHEVQTAYVRMLAGPLDVHSGGFRPVAPADYKPQWLAPNVMGTLARQLAFYVVYENHLPMLADYPEAYAQAPQAFDFVKAVPVTWDETRWVAGEVARSITLARRNGAEWYLGSLTDRSDRTVSIPLAFLGPGNFEAEIYADSSDYRLHPEKVVVSRRQVSAADTLLIALAPAGGSAIRIYPAGAPNR